MRSCLLVILAVIAIHICSAKVPRHLESYAPQKGNVPLVLKNGSFFVHVDFVDHEKDASDTDDDGNTDYGNMMPALYTDKTFFGKECQGFSDYCSKYSFRCSDILRPKEHFIFPYFESGGHSIESEVYLDYGHWKLKTRAMISSGCDGYYSGGYGLLGMGFDGESLINYLTTQPSFAVHIAKGMKNGTLSFQKDFTKVRSSVPVSKVTSDSNWHITGVQSVTFGKTSVPANLSIIFDLGSDSIGIPVETYNAIFAAIQNYPTVGKCQVAADFTATCNYSGDIRKLPHINLELANESLSIPPQAYVVQTQESFFYENSIKLRLKPLSTDQSKGSVVTPAHENYVILGYPMMSYFYTVFDGGHKSIDPKYNVKPSIALYYSIEYESADKYFWYLVGAAIAGFIVIGTAYMCYAKNKKSSKNQQPLLGENRHRARVQ